MALISCKECENPVSTEAVACPHCGAPQQRPAPPVLPAQPKETTIYSDEVVVVTSSRVIIGGTTYALRNITSVRMALISPQVGGPILLLLLGVFILFLTVIPIPFHESNYSPVAGFVLGGGMIAASIFWMSIGKPRYYVGLSSTAGEIHALTSKKKDYIERVVFSINEAIAKHQPV
jgi:hypothetical protein